MCMHDHRDVQTYNPYQQGTKEKQLDPKVPYQIVGLVVEGATLLTTVDAY